MHLNKNLIKYLKIEGLFYTNLSICYIYYKLFSTHALVFYLFSFLISSITSFVQLCHNDFSFAYLRILVGNCYEVSTFSESNQLEVSTPRPILLTNCKTRPDGILFFILLPNPSPSLYIYKYIIIIYMTFARRNNFFFEMFNIFDYCPQVK